MALPAGSHLRQEGLPAPLLVLAVLIVLVLVVHLDVLGPHEVLHHPDIIGHLPQLLLLLQGPLLLLQLLDGSLRLLQPSLQPRHHLQQFPLVGLLGLQLCPLPLRHALQALEPGLHLCGGFPGPPHPPLRLLGLRCRPLLRVLRPLRGPFRRLPVLPRLPPDLLLLLPVRIPVPLGLGGILTQFLHLLLLCGHLPHEPVRAGHLALEDGDEGGAGGATHTGRRPGGGGPRAGRA